VYVCARNKKAHSISARRRSLHAKPRDPSGRVGSDFRPSAECVRHVGVVVSFTYAHAGRERRPSTARACNHVERLTIAISIIILPVPRIRLRGILFPERYSRRTVFYTRRLGFVSTTTCPTKSIPPCWKILFSRAYICIK